MPDENGVVEVHPTNNRLSEEQIALLKRTILDGASNDDVDTFVQICNKTGLDPFTRQICSVRRWSERDKKYLFSTQITIDGMRLIAERSSKYRGQDGPYWCGQDGEWKDVWLKAEPPYASKVGVYRQGFASVLWAVARFSGYTQTGKDGKPTGLWRKMPDLMLSKCAESLALRKAFPFELSGLYTQEEMSQAENGQDESETTLVLAPVGEAAVNANQKTKEEKKPTIKKCPKGTAKKIWDAFLEYFGNQDRAILEIKKLVDKSAKEWDEEDAKLLQLHLEYIRKKSSEKEEEGTKDGSEDNPDMKK